MAKDTQFFELAKKIWFKNKKSLSIAIYQIILLHGYFLRITAQEQVSFTLFIF